MLSKICLKPSLSSHNIKKRFYFLPMGKTIGSYFLTSLLNSEFLSPFKRSQIVHASIVTFIPYQEYIGLLLFAFDYKIKSF